MARVFPGVGVFVSEVLAREDAGVHVRSRIGDDALLHEIGDLLGQACERAEHAGGILDAVAERCEVLRLRRDVAEAAFVAARNLIFPTHLESPVASAAAVSGPARGAGARRR